MTVSVPPSQVCVRTRPSNEYAALSLQSSKQVGFQLWQQPQYSRAYSATGAIEYNFLEEIISVCELPETTRSKPSQVSVAHRLAAHSGSHTPVSFLLETPDVVPNFRETRLALTLRQGTPCEQAPEPTASMTQWKMSRNRWVSSGGS